MVCFDDGTKLDIAMVGETPILWTRYYNDSKTIITQYYDTTNDISKNTMIPLHNYYAKRTSCPL